MPIGRPMALHIVEYLEELVQRDPATMRRLLEARIECGPAISNDPRLGKFVVEAGEDLGNGQKAETDVIGLLGILNGLFPVANNGQGPIAFRVRTVGPFAGAVYRVELTKCYRGCGTCDRELPDHEELEGCAGCGVFACLECMFEEEDGRMFCPVCSEEAV